MVKPLGFYHTRIDGRLRAVWDDGTVTPPVVRGGDEGEEGNPAAGENGGFKPPSSQSELDRIIQARVDRVKATPPADYDDLKAKAARLDEIDAANATELEKAQQRAEAAEAAAANATANANKIAKRAAIIAAASTAKAVDPAMVADLLATNDAVTIDDAGQVTGADTAVKALLEEKTFLVGGTGSVDQGQGRGRGETAGTDAKTAAARLYESRHPTIP